MNRALLLLSLLMPATASAFPWYVADDEEAGAVQSALAELWPEHPIQVIVGEQPAGEDGLSREDRRLVLIANERIYEKDAKGEPMLEVVMVRSWFREVAVADGGWVPEPPTPPVDPDPDPVDPDPVVPPTKQPVQPRARPISLFLGAREAMREPGLTDMVRLGVTANVGSFFVSYGNNLGSLSLARAMAKSGVVRDGDGGTWQVDRWTAELLVGWTPATQGIRPEVALGGAVWGLTEVERIGAVSTESERTRMGPQVYASVVLPLNERFAVRPGWSVRLGWDVDDGVLDHSAVSVDFVVRP